MLGATVGAVATLIAGVAVPWIRDVLDRKRQRIERRRDKLAELIRDCFTELTAAAIADRTSSEEVKARSLEQARIMMEMRLATSSAEADVPNTVMLAFTLVLKDQDQAPDIIGRIARVLPEWRDGELDSHQVFGQFIDGLALDAGMLSALGLATET